MSRPFSAGMFAGILIGSLMTWWLGDITLDLVHRALDRLFTRREPPQFELLLQ